MKRTTLLSLLLLFTTTPLLLTQPIADNDGDVAVGSTTVDPSAVLELTSTAKGFLPPRMTNAQRDAIVSPAEGLIIYNIETDQLEIFSDAGPGPATWQEIESDNAADWQLEGNAATVPGTNFVGTTDAAALHLYVNSGADNSLILNTNGSIQRDGAGNPRGSNATDLQTERNSIAQVAAGQLSVILGGSRNSIEPSGTRSIIVGGSSNSIQGATQNSVIGGGNVNTMRTLGGSSFYNVIAGGSQNEIVAPINHSHATIGGGNANRATAQYTTIGGGQNNEVSGVHATVSGGLDNTASGKEATVAGGLENVASGLTSTVGGGQRNVAGTLYSTITGGQFNTIQGEARWSMIGGGRANVIDEGARFSRGAVIAGGKDNRIEGGNLSTVAGGRGLTLTHNGIFGFLAANATSIDAAPPLPMTITTPNVAVFGNTDLWLANNDNSASQIRFYEANATTGTFPSGTNYTSFEAGLQAVDITYTLPTAAPASGGGNLGDGLLESTSGGTMSWRGSAVASAALNFPNTAAGSASDLTITVTGAAPGDIVNLGVPNGSLPNGANSNENFSAWVSAANTITVRYHNNTGGASDPASGTFAVQVIRP